ncbi:plasmid mobilization protein [Caproiciproducens sp. CPB-2]|uniref:plasmid mobilization protein n=1 Tax=Caproiciproducens sp. CPB-2 TaxID=3030017 RepID=UPI0023D9E265|nr:plasmid mobilization relaxosome protein MobC [Caproiciproducens sp. CPB-2]MDF1494991.1 plasmid mobilization relaxosome protein MobC [Caproiciproducens sp. CPB-2]
MKKQKDKTYAFRVSSADLNKIKINAKRAKLTITDYLTASALNKEITVVDGLESLVPELKAQGRNLNQLTTLAHMGRVYPEQIDRLTDAYGDIFSALKKILEVK